MAYMDLLCYTLLAVTAAYVGVAISFRIGLSCPPPRPAVKIDPFVSVVVAARNEEAYIGYCIASLVGQTYPADRFEVLIVDDGSEDRTADIVQQSAEQHANVKALRVDGAFPEMVAKKRPMSVGNHAARGEIILTTDADCRVPETWIASMVVHFEPDVCAVIGFSQIKNNDAVLNAVERLQGLDFLALMSAAAGAANLGVALAASGQNLAYRKHAFEQVGGFRRIGHRPSGDDVLLFQLMRRTAAGKVRFATDPESFAATWRTESLLGLMRQRRRWASNAPLQAWLNPPFFLYILTVFLVSALIPACAIAGAGTSHLVWPLVCLAVKAGADWLVIHKGARVFGRPDLLWTFPVWELVQIPYILWVGLSGSLFGFVWKGRRHT